MKARCIFMPKIRSSADLRNNYNDISTFCHTNGNQLNRFVRRVAGPI